MGAERLSEIEGIVAKRLADAYEPKLARWRKILSRDYSQRAASSGFASAGDAMPDDEDADYPLYGR